jgi:hypothetical protein
MRKSRINSCIKSRKSDSKSRNMYAKISDKFQHKISEDGDLIWDEFWRRRVFEAFRRFYAVESPIVKSRNVRRLGTSVPKFGTSDGEQSRRFEMFITMLERKVAFWDKGCAQLRKKLYRICRICRIWTCHYSAYSKTGSHIFFAYSAYVFAYYFAYPAYENRIYLDSAFFIAYNFAYYAYFMAYSKSAYYLAYSAYFITYFASYSAHYSYFITQPVTDSTDPR